MKAKLCLLTVFVLCMAMVGIVSADLPVDPIPEYPSISIPVVGLLGLLFFFNYRKRRKEEVTKEKDNDLEDGK